jgi:hypothetical protein
MKRVIGILEQLEGGTGMVTDWVLRELVLALRCGTRFYRRK